MKIYTRTGDEGKTSVIGGRVFKDDVRVEAYGTIDELNSFVGSSVSLMEDAMFSDMKKDLTEIQHELFDCGSDLSALKPGPKGYKVNAIMVERLEQWIDRYDQETKDLTRFILPGGTLLSSSLHICRTVCRRAERRVVTLAAQADINEHVRTYVNRLSDLFFTLARVSNQRLGEPDVEYVRSAEVFKNRP
ncbi:cob(I)yrinic acid a,c-diamide adenosyltransferase [Marinicrinis lubricantis]|uniref:Corrinoid adenosyltransferase n=1 Tax=Marinicrinis lubricantis TaxID=2086470 RepID=A0ABW1ILN1_9BACL